MYTNVDSITNKLHELKSLLINTSPKPKVIALTEAKHKSRWSAALSEFNIPGYNIYSNNLSSNNRGIIVYASQDLSCKVVNVNVDFSEFLVLEIEGRCAYNNTTIGVIYRSPSSKSDNDLKLHELINTICTSQSNNKIILMGDFNWPNIDWQSCSSSNSHGSETKFLDILRKNYLSQHIDKPTRIRGDDEPHILDLVITNEPFIDHIEYLAPLGKSDHSILNIHCCAQAQKITKVDKYNYAKADFDGLRDSCKMNWEDILCPFSSELEDMWAHFIKELQNRISQYIPKQKDFNAIKKDTWKRPLNSSLRQLIARKNRLWTRYMETRDATIHKKYKSIRNKVRNETRKLQIEEQRQVASKCKENPKIFWKFINSKRKVYEHIGDLKTKDTDGNVFTASTNSEKAEVLGNFFASVFVTEPHSVPPNLQLRSCHCAFTDPVFSEEIIFEKLNNLKIAKSPGPDNIHPRILYELRHELILPLKIIFETSYKLNQLPSDWKIGHITAIFKKGSKVDPSNYRPISLTSIICKVMESIIRDHIMKFFICNDYFTEFQYGFIKGRSTALQLLSIMDEWTSILDSGGQVDAIYTDFAKAFDTVPHRRLLCKLKSYNINEKATAWIRNFLCDRKQRICVNGEFSTWSAVLSGIPQGSILGPLLFLIYINDLPAMCTQQDISTKIYLYADDAKIYKFITQMRDQADLQTVMNSVKNWSDEWLLRLNIDKCKTVSYYLHNPFSTQYHITHDNKTYILDQLSSINDLGVTFDSKLSFKDHISQKINKAYSILGIIKRNFIHMDEISFILLYKTMVRPHLEYANSVWCPYKKGDIKDIEKVQKRATKLVIKFKGMSYPDRLLHLKLPTLKYRRLRGDMIEVFKITHNIYDPDASLKLAYHSGSITRGNKYKLSNHRFHYDLRKHYFSARIVNIWNSLPNHVVDVNTVNLFKTRLDRYWINQDVKYDFTADLTGIGDRSVNEIYDI